jgi:tetratricopeptide (TPR) repeat protein
MAGSHPSKTRQRLDSWKEIATFFGRDERTVNRWEKERGLPVHRLPGSKGRVYAYTDELWNWLSAPRNASAMLREVAIAPESETGGSRHQLHLVDGGPSDAETVPLPIALSSPPSGAVSPGVSPARYTRLILAIVALVIAAALLLFRRYAPFSSGEATGTGSTSSRNLSSRGSVQASSHAHNPEAEQLYLRGRFYWNKRTPDDLNRAVDYFVQAIVHDPNYAAAYVGLADCYNLLREYTVMPANEAYPRAFAAAQKAVELDDQSSAAHASLAFVLFWGRWDAANAENEFRRAIDLDPQNSIAHHWYANYLLTVERLSESLAEIEHAQALDPTSTSILADKGNILFHTGRRDEAVALLTQMEATEPSFRSPHAYLKEIYLMAGDYPNFLAESKKDAVSLHDNTALNIVTVAEKGYALSGANGMFESMLQLQKKYYAEKQLSPVVLAQTYALLGNKEDALKYLKLAYDQHDELLLAIKIYPALATLHSEPAFRDLVERMNLPAES